MFSPPFIFAVGACDICPWLSYGKIVRTNNDTFLKILFRFAMLFASGLPIILIVASI